MTAEDTFLEVEAAGETIGEAKWQAMRELERLHPGLDRDAVTFDVLTEGERGLLGVGTSPARVLARVEATAVREPEAPERSRLTAGRAAARRRRPSCRRARGQSEGDRLRGRRDGAGHGFCARRRDDHRPRRPHDRRRPARRVVDRVSTPGTGRQGRGGRRRRLPRAAPLAARGDRSGGGRARRSRWSARSARADERPGAASRPSGASGDRGRGDAERGRRPRPVRRRRALASAEPE